MAGREIHDVAGDFRAQLTAAEELFNNAIDAIAEKARCELILPACRKHRLRFVSGMGTFFFAKGSDCFDDPLHPDFARLPSAAQATLRPIFDLLNKEVGHMQYFGYWVADADPAKERPRTNGAGSEVA